MKEYLCILDSMVECQDILSWVEFDVIIQLSAPK